MVGRQKKTLPLVGLVVSLPTAAGFAPTRQGGRSSSAVDVSLSSDAEASRRAFLVASSSLLVATAFVRPAEADVGQFKLKDLFKRNEQVDSTDSDSDSDDSDSDSVSSEDEIPKENGKGYGSSFSVKEEFKEINGSTLDESSPAADDVTAK